MPKDRSAGSKADSSRRHRRPVLPPVRAVLTLALASSAAFAERPDGAESRKLHSPSDSPIQNEGSGKPGRREELPRSLKELGVESHFPRLAAALAESMRPCPIPGARRSVFDCWDANPEGSREAQMGVVNVGGFLECVKLTREASGAVLLPLAVRRCSKAHAMAALSAIGELSSCAAVLPGCEAPQAVIRMLSLLATLMIQGGCTAEEIYPLSKFELELKRDSTLEALRERIADGLQRWVLNGFASNAEQSSGGPTK